MSGTGDKLTITEAAELLGVHRNTIRNRIKAGTYKAHKVLTAQGETYVIEPESLGLPSQPGTQQASQAQTTTVHHNPSQAGRGNELTPADFQAANEAAIQRLLEPFVRDLAAAHQTIGRLEAERDQLRRELEDAKAARLKPIQAAQSVDTAGQVESVTQGQNEAQTGKERPWWQFWR